jgi:hypothetical protein
VITIRLRLRKIKKKLKTKRIHRRGYKRRSTALHKLHEQPQELQYTQKLLEQAAVSFNQGFDAGYDEALMKSEHAVTLSEQSKRIEQEYKKGFYYGGEGIVDSILPELDILPNISLQQIIITGMEQMRSLTYSVLGAKEVAGRLIHAMNTKSPLSVVRLGDGELLTLAQNVVLNDDQVRKEGQFLSYAGIHLPDLAARDLLVHAIRRADIVGIPKMRMPNFQPLAFSVFNAHGIDFQQLQLTLSTINYMLYTEGLLRELLANRRVLAVGNSSLGLAQVLASLGIHVVGAIFPVDGMRDITRVMGEIAARDFDIALVGAGVPAVVIVQRIASELRKVAFDFGHLTDSLVSGEAAL